MMKIPTKCLLVLSILSSFLLSLSLNAKEVVDKKLADAITSCNKFIDKSKDSVNADSFVASYSDAYRPVTRSDYQNLVARTCFEGIAAAQRFNRVNDLDEFLFSMRSNWVSVLGGDIMVVEKISRSYFMAIHGIKSDEDVSYPQLSKNASTEQKVTALEDFSLRKLLRGMPIKSHCESITSSMPDKTKPTPELRNAAMQVCEGIMTMNLTDNKHGINASKAREINDKTYQRGTIEHRYIDSTITMSLSESGR